MIGRFSPMLFWGVVIRQMSQLTSAIQVARDWRELIAGVLGFGGAAGAIWYAVGMRMQRVSGKR